MAWRGTVSRSLLYAARSSVGRSLPRARPPPIAAPRLPRRHRPAFAPTRSFGELGCTQSLLPLHSMVAAARLTSHLSVDFRAWRELSQGTLFCRTCPDR